MKVKLALLSVLLAVPLILNAQTAKVIKLSDADAEQAKALYAEKAQVETKITELEIKIHKDYITLWSPSEQNGVSYGFPKSGWTSLEFEYSDDFKYIVPKPYPANFVIGGTGCFTTSPYFEVPNHYQ